MPDRPLPSDNREASTPFWGNKRYVVMGIVAGCVLVALAILGGGMFDTGEKDTTQPPRPVTTQSEARHRLSRSQAPKHRQQAKLKHHNRKESGGRPPKRAPRLSSALKLGVTALDRLYARLIFRTAWLSRPGRAPRGVQQPQRSRPLASRGRPSPCHARWSAAVAGWAFHSACSKC